MRYVKLDKRVPDLCYMTSGSGGIDLCCTEKLVLCPGGRITVQTGIALEIPQGYVGLVTPRSSAGIKLGISLANTIGVIDSDYRGEVLLFLQSESFCIIDRHQRIAQLIVVPYYSNTLEEVDSLTTTIRGSGGFGSTE